MIETIDEMQDKYLYRACSKEEIIELFTNRKLTSVNKGFISLSKDEFIFDESIEFGRNNEYLVTYDASKIYAQGGIALEYTEEFMNLNPDLLYHLLELNYIEELANWLKETNQSDTPEEYIDLYFSEQEVVIKEINFESGLIINIVRKEEKELDKEIIELLLNFKK